MSEKKYILPEQVRKALIEYLQTKPMKEVRVGVLALEQLEEIKECVTADKK